MKMLQPTRNMLKNGADQEAVESNRREEEIARFDGTVRQTTHTDLIVVTVRDGWTGV